jgi:hypothetical protein
LVASGAITCATLGGLSPFNATNLNLGSIPLARITGVMSSPGLTDTNALGAWTPSEQSGASLVFTGVSALYTKIGNMVFAYAQLSYPATADRSAAVIGGPPVNFTVANYGRQCRLTYANGTSAIAYLLPVGGTATFGMQSNAGAAITNANLSGLALIFECIYPATRFGLSVARKLSAVVKNAKIIRGAVGGQGDRLARRRGFTA